MLDFDIERITLRDYLSVGRMHTRSIEDGSPTGHSSYTASAGLTLIPHVGVMVETHSETAIIPFIQIATIIPKDPAALKKTHKVLRKKNKIKAKIHPTDAAAL